MVHFSANRLSFIYACLAIALVLWQHFGMNYVIDIVPTADGGIHMTNDDKDGGASVGVLTVADGMAQLDCTTRASQSFAYCGFLLPLDASGKERGLDLTRFSSVEFDLKFKSDVRDTVLIYLHTAESVKGERRTRIHMYPISPKPGLERYHLELDDFFVPSWWLLYFAKNQSDSGVNLANVVSLQVTTGDNRAIKNVQLALGRVTFKGKWIYAGLLYFYLLIGGLLIVLLRSVTSVLSYRNKYRETRLKSAELYKLNKVLSVERDKYENLSKTDPLTGCLNRAGARELLEILVSSPPASGPRAALILLDIDHFKRINDSYGHEAGDRVLVALSTYLRDHTRAEDAVVRWGGEEFAIICPHASGQQAATRAEQLRVKLPEVLRVQEEGVSCSFGVAEFLGTDVEAWFRRADTALYQAKADGRNRVVSAN